MAKPKTAERDPGRRVRGTTQEAVQTARAEEAGARFEWHYGRVTRLGSFDIPGSREATIIWEEGGVTSQQGEINDQQWEVLKLAFQTTGRVAVLSDLPGDKWMYDYRFLEAVR